MRLVRKDINTRDGDGTVTLLPQEPEDMVGYIVFVSQTLLETNVKPLVAPLQPHPPQRPTPRRCYPQSYQRGIYRQHRHQNHPRNPHYLCYIH